MLSRKKNTEDECDRRENARWTVFCARFRVSTRVRSVASAVLSALLRRRAHFASLKPQSRSPPIIRLFRLAHHSPRLVLLRPPISRRENCRQGPKLAPVLERRRRVQNVPRRYRLGLRTNRLAHQAHRKLDRALASEQKRLLHDERLEDAARQTRATAKVLGEERSGKVQNDHERVGVEDEVRRKKNERLYST